MIVLDTSFLIDYFKGVEETKHLVKSNDNVAITTVTYHEIKTGLKRKKMKKEEMLFRRFFSRIPILDFDIRAAEESSSIAAKLLAIGLDINVLDVLIAGIAIANGAEKILTADRNFLEIEKVSDLEVVLYR
ncbi:PIN domain-containing protein [Archaeoglobus veneficus]|uniref:Ribonuclease VapC n=1 Tax=Archaeoglobus veneficus (strain DSM 11195 / SNP6) TaxID=693661 RepID=F2KPT1_ARCVS|nr:PIN domain-containing protein [Archaeoglobus veneficus]AEA46438.1 PilT protein domain protein [Archaeoglobus veneficus SNP6]